MGQAVLSRGLGDPQGLPPPRPPLPGVPVTEGRGPSQATVQARGLGGRPWSGDATHSVGNTSEQAVAWLPEASWRLGMARVAGSWSPDHERLPAEGCGRELRPGSVTTAGTRAWPPCGWTSAPDGEARWSSSLPICMGSLPGLLTQHMNHMAQAVAWVPLRSSGCPRSVTPTSMVRVASSSSTLPPGKAENCPPEQICCITRHTHTRAADPTLPTVHAHRSEAEQDGENAAAAAGFDGRLPLLPK